ncbi:GTPase activating protein (GAP) for Rho1p [Entomophthora muscae]|uniref:GTPase activating protein (GAP) for Rho1p n=1 Tax=Entomophthora muscae TaxID=34485 RepID=A0ACC2SQE5_9FUNG|nr:GTPase activating protein (GAP) for Rho1p [Entomophthora muscae]
MEFLTAPKLHSFLKKVSLQTKPRVFGGSLKTYQREATLHAYPGVKVHVPTVVDICCSYLRIKATTTEGIFRVSGSLGRMRELQMYFEKNLILCPIPFEDLGLHPADVAGVLTRYLKMLPKAVIPPKFFHLFRQISSQLSDSDQALEYQALVNSLPTSNRDLLIYLLDFLSEMAQHAPKTLMDVNNLAKVFQPSILSLSQHALVPAEYNHSKEVLEFLILNFTSLTLYEPESPLPKRRSTSSLIRSWLNRSNSNSSYDFESPPKTPQASFTFFSRPKSQTSDCKLN